jgi:phage N-6-adenine-methyltransferase
MTKLVRSTAGALTQYDPKKGTKKIAFLEMAEKHYAKAKDATKLRDAIRGKLEAQAEFVWWWDTQVEKQEGRPEKRHRSETLIAGQNGLPDRQTIHRWRSKLGDPDTFEQTFAHLCAKYPKLLEFADGDPHVAYNSGENEWYTPADLIEAARTTMGGIDLDPATTPEANTVVQAAQIFTAKENGLTQRWDGRVWLNPPYEQPLVAQFCDKLAEEVGAGHVTAACVLVNNATETQWFRTLADVAGAICFPTGRVRFWSPTRETAAPLQGQAVLYVGPHGDGFGSAFHGFGVVVTVQR